MPVAVAPKPTTYSNGIINRLVDEPILSNDIFLFLNKKHAELALSLAPVLAERHRPVILFAGDGSQSTHLGD